MTKKKTKKKAVKRTRRTPEAVIDDHLWERYQMSCRARLFRKAAKVWEAIPGFEAMKDESEGSEGINFGYTRASEVFKAYREECAKHRLHWFPKKKSKEITLRQVFTEGEWMMVDLDTGYAESFAGLGQGNNGVWAIQSAQTVGLKQGLLEFFNAYWVEPEDPGRDEVDPWGLQREPQTPQELFEQMGEFFTAYKEKKAKADSKKRK